MCFLFKMYIDKGNDFIGMDEKSFENIWRVLVKNATFATLFEKST